jgi:hypothetical protein
LLTLSVENVVGFVEAVKMEGGYSQILQKARETTSQRMPDAAKWGSVSGPMASAIATLRDWGWSATCMTTWRDPDGYDWHLDYADPLLPEALKEVLGVHFSKRIWATLASQHFAGPSLQPDFTSYHKLRKALKKQQDWRKLYYLGAIIQGGAHCLAERHIGLNDDGASVCSQCGDLVSGCPLKHFTYYCSAILSLELKGIEASSHLVEQARAELEVLPAKWLRKLLPLDVPDSLTVAIATAVPILCSMSLAKSMQEMARGAGIARILEPEGVASVWS